MKFILTLLLLLTFTATPALAATASLSLTKNRYYVHLNFGDLKNVSRVNYTLTYDSSSGQKGFEGGFKLKPKISRSSRRQILGTCSSGRCVYHKNIKNVSLDAAFTLRSGGTVNVTRSLP